ncbi:hypothetical protein BCR32DRAFT_327612 [Anaeromyces robustus]|jgi:hypothetical protein|uniref:Uncharacterized protein n=1 Tax=Anaeromyces robustus TaxID=1754192 RepID=A0A1Y1X4X3_9FUNG|nr:hypothetical protein BCR32DRAFT_327612 [Anaeromyces robustus]|eukprot:ORX80695.1 hypothetical protein BCR32DRAFT_327612 [Anaeromyces robustus]
MRFSSVALTLLAVSSVFGAVAIDGKCKEEDAKYSKCNDYQAKGFAKASQSKDCQKYYKDALKVAPSCKKSLSKEQQKEYLAEVKASKAYSIIYNSKDENGKDCPLVKHKNMKSAKETTKSQKCTDDAFEAYELLADANKNGATVSDADKERDDDILKVLKKNGKKSSTTTTKKSKSSSSTTTTAAAATTAAPVATTTAIAGAVTTGLPVANNTLAAPGVTTGVPAPATTTAAANVVTSDASSLKKISFTAMVVSVAAFLL